jgi:hypothetical protein
MSKTERDPLTIVGWRAPVLPGVLAWVVCAKCAKRYEYGDPIYVGTDESRERCKTCGNFLDLDDPTPWFSEGPR